MAARTKNPVYLFLVEHGRHPKVKNSELLALGDNSSKTPGPDIFTYTEGMPIMINSNRHTILGIVNGRKELLLACRSILHQMLFISAKTYIS